MENSSSTLQREIQEKVEISRDLALGYVMKLRDAGIPAVLASEDKSLKAQMREANRLNSKYVLFIQPETVERIWTKLKMSRNS